MNEIWHFYWKYDQKGHIIPNSAYHTKVYCSLNDNVKYFKFREISTYENDLHIYIKLSLVITRDGIYMIM